MLSNHVQNIVSSLARNGYAAKVERLSVYLAIHGDDEQFAEIGRIHIAGCEDVFV